MLREPQSSRRCDTEGQPLSLKPDHQPLNLQVDNGAKLLLAKGIKDNHVIQSVQELRFER